MSDTKLEPCPADILEAVAEAIQYADTKLPWYLARDEDKAEYRKLAAAAIAAWNQRAGWRTLPSGYEIKGPTATGYSLVLNGRCQLKIDEDTVMGIFLKALITPPTEAGGKS